MRKLITLTLVAAICLSSCAVSRPAPTNHRQVTLLSWKQESARKFILTMASGKDTMEVKAGFRRKQRLQAGTIYTLQCDDTYKVINGTRQYRCTIKRNQ